MNVRCARPTNWLYTLIQHAYGSESLLGITKKKSISAIDVAFFRGYQPSLENRDSLGFANVPSQTLRMLVIADDKTRSAREPTNYRCSKSVRRRTQKLPTYIRLGEIHHARRHAFTHNHTTPYTVIFHLLFAAQLCPLLRYSGRIPYHTPGMTSPAANLQVQSTCRGYRTDIGQFP